MSELRGSPGTCERLDVSSLALHGFRFSIKDICACIETKLLYYFGGGGGELEGKVGSLPIHFSHWPFCMHLLLSDEGLLLTQTCWSWVGCSSCPCWKNSKGWLQGIPRRLSLLEKHPSLLVWEATWCLLFCGQLLGETHRHSGGLRVRTLIAAECSTVSPWGWWWPRQRGTLAHLYPIFLATVIPESSL